jgi:hypothetical protein
LATPEGVATPLPYTTCTLAPGVSVRLHCRATKRSGSFSAALSRPKALSRPARWSPSSSFTGMRSPTPSAAHQMFWRTLSSVAAPLSSSTNICCSSMRL